MTYVGHVENGVIIVDEPIDLPEGTVVQIQPIVKTSDSDHSAIKSLRGTPYRFDDPLSPACDESDWEALQ
jgi:hypothetical protein